MTHLIATLSQAVCLTTFLATSAAWAQQPPLPEVDVVTLEAQDITLSSKLPGRIVASGVAEVRPQVAGIITERLFREGSAVEVGDPLYRIDSASYAAQVAAAQASVSLAQVNLRAAERDATRIQTLFERKVASDQNVEDANSTRESMAAALQVAQAQLQAAEIDLEHTTIRAELSGLVGRSLTTRGALVTSGQAAPLAIIRTLDPVYVDVTQSAAELIRARRGLRNAALVAADQTVSLTLADGLAYEHTGLLTAAEPYVDELTGVVVLRLEFPNPDLLLLPGMYVQVELPQGVAKGVILAPQEGVGRDRRGRPIAMVVNADNVVETRDLVTLGDHGAFWIVEDGLETGDRIIVAGLQKIGVGMTVAPVERANPEPKPEPAN
ncbi:efflux RND transporter periplasmic adaptor subunit [Sedimentitalea nanhaiensis]|uniref:Membrane fusion protein, multidrug efflux system n=1 Tax=Sedimentitalea nanhaiensis TaxID=999627 RepID=A0A1I7C5G2_9RHOB|nr:efflux RND transporter periplasmic adaptor subunit [Sedimentitalea nanhaiensis]SFT94671.1 membrane fusion protein, multidrug efflux system [Sedimentitalea nanhaiensis]